MVGPSSDEVYFEACGGGHQGATIEADAGAGVLRGETDGLDGGDAVGAHLLDDVGDEGVPVAHADIDAGAEGFGQQAALPQGPAGEGRAFGEGFIAEADGSVAVLELGDDLFGEGSAAGDAGEIVGHFAENVGGSVSEEEDGAGVGRGKIFDFKHDPPIPPKMRQRQ